ncbi:phosphotransferase [Rhodococcus sp. NPDC058521]|uniref:phosphotransferase n=1 Tax=Rhodococcus sp. NPDC058521 TaxID=3346536 RepID=UPI00365B1D12
MDDPTRPVFTAHRACLRPAGRHLPEDDTPAVFYWGESRIGNVMYQNFRPAAVLDWEMATLGPRELDLGCIVFRLDDVAEEYEAATGHTPHDLKYHFTYAALRQATIILRIQTRAIHFGQTSMPEDPDGLIMHRTSLEAMLEGSCWRTCREYRPHEKYGFTEFTDTAS